MTTPDQDVHGSIPPGVLDALRSNRKVGAIKILREATGLGLRDAKELLESIDATGSGTLPRSVDAAMRSPPPTPEDADAALPGEVLTALRAGHKVKAIKMLREARGIGLKEAKDMVDAVMPAANGNSSGTVQRGGGSGVAVTGLLLAAVAAVAAYLWFANG